MAEIGEIIEYVDHENASSSGDVFANMSDEEFMNYMAEMEQVVTMELITSVMADVSSRDDKSNNVKSKDGGEDLNIFLSQVQDVKADGLAFIKDIATCPNCGEMKKQWSPMTWCSAKCAVKDIAKMALSSWDPKEKKNEERLEKIEKVIDTINDITNIVTAIPQIILHADALIEEYKKYVYVKVAIMAKMLQKAINNVLIWKNEIIIDMLKDAKNGIIGDVVSSLISGIDALLQKIDKLVEKFQTLYEKAMEAINATSTVWGLKGEEMGFFFTIRSILPTHKPGKFNVAFQMDLNLYESNVHNVLGQKLGDMINVAFPPITNEEYFLAPGAFKLRVLLSDQNGKAIKKIINTVEFIMAPGAQYLPKYKKLSLLNPWFDLATLYDWAPISREVFGLPLPQ